MKQVMVACDLRQTDLADVLGVSLSRVKAMTSGRVKKLTPEETRKLVTTLNLSAHWLATGELPMFNTMGGEKLSEALTKVKLTATRVSALGLRDEEARAVAEIANGISFSDAAMVQSGLALAAQANLAGDEKVLLANFRGCSDQAKAQLVQMAALLAAGVNAGVHQTPARRSGNSIRVDGGVGRGAVVVAGKVSKGIRNGDPSEGRSLAKKASEEDSGKPRKDRR